MNDGRPQAARTPEPRPANGEMIEKVARAICQAEAKRHYSINRGVEEAWTAATDYARSEWLADAEAVLAAYNPNERLREALEDARLFVDLVHAHWQNWHDDPEQVAEAKDCLTRIDAALSHKEPE